MLSERLLADSKAVGAGGVDRTESENEGLLSEFCAAVTGRVDVVGELWLPERMKASGMTSA